jgi:hypothetical protein
VRQVAESGEALFHVQDVGVDVEAVHSVRVRLEELLEKLLGLVELWGKRLFLLVREKKGTVIIAFATDVETV